MERPWQIAILSDIHYACAAEQARGDDFEYRDLANPFARLLLRNYRHYIWLRNPLHQNHLLDRFIASVGSPDLVIANGDYACDTASIGVSDDAACQSARECLQKLRARFAPRFHALMGDHDLGKVSFVGGRGGMRVASWLRAQSELGMETFWQFEIGEYVLLGVASSLVALPTFEPDTLPAERDEWHRLREEHISQVRSAFNELKLSQRVLLFCHDPTALPFLWREDSVRAKIAQIEQTIIGHLHTNLILWKSRMLAGMPRLRFLGHSATRMTTALSEARYWRPFHVRLCPALAGVQLLKDGGYLTVSVDPSARHPAQFGFHSLRD